MKKDEDPSNLWTKLVHRTIEVRGVDRGFIARVRHGISSENEARAYADVIPYAGETRNETALLRAVAIIARHPAIPHTPKSESEPSPKLGASFQRMSRALASRRNQVFELDPGNPDVIARRLSQMHTQDLNDAAITFDRILTIAGDSGVGIDYFALTRTLLRWGNGFSDASQNIRRTVLRDYYRFTGTTLAATESADQDTN